MLSQGQSKLTAAEERERRRLSKKILHGKKVTRRELDRSYDLDRKARAALSEASR